jgi:hypothetical protein
VLWQIVETLDLSALTLRAKAVEGRRATMEGRRQGDAAMQCAGAHRFLGRRPAAPLR